MACVENLYGDVCNSVILPSTYSDIEQTQLTETPFTLDTVPLTWLWSYKFKVKKLHNVALAKPNPALGLHCDSVADNIESIHLLSDYVIWQESQL